MNRLFFRLVCLTTPLLFNSAKSQPDHFAYAVTAVDKGGSDWVALRKLDIRTGAFSPILLNVQNIDPQINGFTTGTAYAHQSISNPANNISVTRQLSTLPADRQASTVNGVAAIAYDRKTNRLYYTAMNIDQLRYIDLTTMESFSVSNQFFSKAGNYDSRNAGPINRLVIAPDDFGYTITNDGTHLIRFTTHGSPVLTDLGDLVDDPLNKEMTIHSPCANSGGDLVADDAGHLYLITGSNKVYKVDIATRITTYLATVAGLPQKFTTSGVAVSEDGSQILAVSSTYSDAYYIIDPETWHASPAMATNDLYESADLANSNILFTKSAANDGLFISKNPENWNRIRIFPNPVMDDEVGIQFNQLPPGDYTIQLANSLGKKVIEKKVTITSSAQTEFMHLAHYTSQGFYYIRILDEKNNVVSTQKLVVERW
jgi:Secretion system C-terminal sorting domain